MRYVFRDARYEPVRPGAFGEGDIDRYVEALSRPGTLTAATNFYRALARQTSALARAPPRPIEAPVLVIWGERDRFLVPNPTRSGPALAPYSGLQCS